MSDQNVITKTDFTNQTLFQNGYFTPLFVANFMLIILIVVGTGIVLAFDKAGWFFIFFDILYVLYLMNGFYSPTMKMLRTQKSKKDAEKYIMKIRQAKCYYEIIAEAFHYSKTKNTDALGLKNKNITFTNRDVVEMEFNYDRSKTILDLKEYKKRTIKINFAPDFFCDQETSAFIESRKLHWINEVKYRDEFYSVTGELIIDKDYTPSFLCYTSKRREFLMHWIVFAMSYIFMFGWIHTIYVNKRAVNLNYGLLKYCSYLKKNEYESQMANSVEVPSGYYFPNPDSLPQKLGSHEELKSPTLRDSGAGSMLNHPGQIMQDNNILGINFDNFVRNSIQEKIEGECRVKIEKKDEKDNKKALLKKKVKPLKKKKGKTVAHEYPEEDTKSSKIEFTDLKVVEIHDNVIAT